MFQQINIHVSDEKGKETLSLDGQEKTFFDVSGDYSRSQWCVKKVKVQGIRYQKLRSSRQTLDPTKANVHSFLMGNSHTKNGKLPINTKKQSDKTKSVTYTQKKGSVKFTKANWLKNFQLKLLNFQLILRDKLFTYYG